MAEAVEAAPDTSGDDDEQPLLVRDKEDDSDAPLLSGGKKRKDAETSDIETGARKETKVRRCRVDGPPAWKLEKLEVEHADMCERRDLAIADILDTTVDALPENVAKSFREVIEYASALEEQRIQHDCSGTLRREWCVNKNTTRYTVPNYGEGEATLITVRRVLPSMGIALVAARLSKLHRARPTGSDSEADRE